jgi:hypothetical protein
MNSEEFEDEAREALAEWRAVRKSLSCACGNDPHGSCPGRENCPMEQDNYEEEETE